MAPGKLIKVQIMILRVWSRALVSACLTHSQKVWTLLLQGPPTEQEQSRTAVPDKSESFFFNSCCLDSPSLQILISLLWNAEHWDFKVFQVILMFKLRTWAIKVFPDSPGLGCDGHPQCTGPQPHAHHVPLRGGVSSVLWGTVQGSQDVQ